MSLDPNSPITSHAGDDARTKKEAGGSYLRFLRTHKKDVNPLHDPKNMIMRAFHASRYLELSRSFHTVSQQYNQTVSWAPQPDLA